MEELVLGLFLATGVSLWALEYHRRRQFLAEARAAWEQGSNHSPLVEATWFTVDLVETGLSRQKYWNGPTGVLGLSDKQIVFSCFDHDRDVSIPFEAVRWVGTREIEYPAPFSRRTGKIRERILIVDCEFPEESGADRWPVYAWSSPRQGELGGTLAKICGLESSEDGGDFGASYALRLNKDCDGTWHEIDEGLIYLVTDRLLFNWDDQIPYSSIQRIETISRGPLEPLLTFFQGSFQIDYCDADGTVQPIGFQVSDSEKWVEQLRKRCYSSQKGETRMR